MRLVLCTFGLIFLKIVYASDDYPQVINHGEDQDHVDLSIYRDQDSYVYSRPRFSKLQNFMKERFAGKVEAADRSETSTERIPIRHKKHNSHKKRPYGSASAYYGNEVKISEEKDSYKNLVKNQYPWNENTYDEKSTGTWDIEQNDAAPSLSPVSQSKLDSLGTEEKVREKFQFAYGTLPVAAALKNEDPMEKAAKAHYKEMITRTACKSPTPKLIRVQDIYPIFGKKYLPPCTIIHQCSDESGCCVAPYRCAPNKIQNVSLFFLLDESNVSKRIAVSLSFLNHTECKCQPNNEPADRKTRGAPSLNQPSFIEITPKFQYSSLVKRCPLPCPSSFSPLFLSNGTCICDCTPNNNVEACLKHKRGEMHFNHSDNYCLFTNQCTYPSCAYGNYLAGVGRCPTQKERRKLN